MNIRSIQPDDCTAWSRLRTLLWPDTDDAHMSEIEAFFTGQSHDVVAVFVAETMQGVVAFIELNVRNFAEGSRQGRVPYVEGWLVDPAFQNQGIGKALMSAAESWAVDQGYTELASDTEHDNVKSQEIHAHLGFKEVERVVCFLKALS